MSQFEALFIQAVNKTTSKQQLKLSFLLMVNNSSCMFILNIIKTAMIKFIIIVALLLLSQCQYGNHLTITLVTALWKPSSSQDEGPIPYTKQLQMLDLLVKTDENMIIFGDEELIKRVMNVRNKTNTAFVVMEMKELQANPSAQQIKRFLEQFKQTSSPAYNKHLDLPQFKSTQYASTMFSKPFLLNKALSYDIFNSDYMYWVDPDIQSFQFYHGKMYEIFSKKYSILRKFSHQLQLPFIIRSGNTSNLLTYKDNGKLYGNITTFAMDKWFGGRVQAISTFAAVYDDQLRVTLKNGDYWSHESIFSIMIHRYPKLLTEIYNIRPQGFYNFYINNFRERPVRQIRHATVTVGDNSTIKFGSKYHAPLPIFSTKFKTYQNFYEFQILVNSYKFRADREKLFLTSLVFFYVVVRLLKRVQWPKKGEVALPMEEQSQN